MARISTSHKSSTRLPASDLTAPHPHTDWIKQNKPRKTPHNAERNTMTTEELKNLLRRIADHLNHLQDQLYDTPLHAARYSQTDARKTNSEPAAPTDLTTLDYFHGHVDPVIRGWCYNLANSHTLGHLPHDQPTSVWTAWLARHATTLLTTDYAQDCIQELQELETELRTHIHPQDPHEIKLPDYATVDEIAQALGKTAAAVRKWCERKQVTKYIQGGLVHYRTAEIKA